MVQHIFNIDTVHNQREILCREMQWVLDLSSTPEEHLLCYDKHSYKSNEEGFFLLIYYFRLISFAQKRFSSTLNILPNIMRHY